MVSEKLKNENELKQWLDEIGYSFEEKPKEYPTIAVVRKGQIEFYYKEEFYLFVGE